MIDARIPAVSAETLLDMLEARAESHPDRLASIFCRDDGDRQELTYAALAQRAKAIAAELQRRMSVGERVLLVFPPGLDFITGFFGCLYAGVLAVPATYPKPRRPMPRLAAIAHDCQPAAVLTTTQTLATLELARTAPELEGVEWLAVDGLADTAGARWNCPNLSRDSLAFLQYTSGSTSDPKGVMVSHGNLLHNLKMIRGGFGIGDAVPAQSYGVFWLPSYHDMGLIGGILEPLHTGGTSVLMSPASFLQRPLRWLQMISEFGATISGAPNFAYELCVEKTTSQQRRELDLSSWQVAFCGAEPIRPCTLANFAAAFAPCGFRGEAFYPCYGLAEATLIVSGGRGPSRPATKTVLRSRLAQHRVVDAAPHDSDAQTLVGCGGALLHTEIAIVDPETRRRCHESEVGEVWVAGPAVARGYWNRPQENGATFHAHRTDVSDDDGASDVSYLRTGDLGFLDGEQLYVTGRRKDVIIIRGRNHYPQDMERTAEKSHAALCCSGGAVFAVQAADEERLVVVHEVDRQFRDGDLDSVMRAIRREIAREHDVEAHAVVLIRQTDLPRTTSGKVQRQLCRQRYLSGDLKVMAQWTAPAAAAHSNGHATNGHATKNGHYSNGHTANGAAHEHVTHPPTERPAVSDVTSPGSVANAQAKPRPHPMTPEEIDRLAERIETWLLDWLMRRAEVPSSELDRDKPLADYGIDSLAAVELSQELEAYINIETGDKQGLAESYSNIGLIKSSQGNQEEALDYQQKSLDLEKELDNKQGISIAYHNIGDIYAAQNKIPLAFENYKKGLTLAEQIGNRDKVALGYIKISTLYLRQKKYAQAEKLGKDALKLTEELGIITNQRDASKLLYETYKAWGKGSDALKYHEKFLALSDSVAVTETNKRLDQMEFEKRILADSLKKEEEKLQVKIAHEAEVLQKDKQRNKALYSGGAVLLLALALLVRLRYVRKARVAIQKEKDRSENLLLNILPAEIADELKLHGKAEARDFDLVSILFTDFKGFTSASEKMNAKELVAEINYCFEAFDGIVGKYKIEKIKTIGDSYMAAGGLPVPTPDAVKNTVLAALEMQDFIHEYRLRKEYEARPAFQMRAGIHTGPVVAGIVGVKKFQYDVWGDTVNTASRMESSGEVGCVNISQTTYELIANDPMFHFESRGKIEAKGKGALEMYYVRLAKTNTNIDA